jgi:hypothetical protein
MTDFSSLFAAFGGEHDLIAASLQADGVSASGVLTAKMRTLIND